MPNEERLRLQAMAARIGLVRGWAEEMDEETFLDDAMAKDAMAMSLLVIGETARRLLDKTKQAAPDVPWPAIQSLRNRIAHGYETVDHRMVWRIVLDDLPELAEAIDRLLAA